MLLDRHYKLTGERRALAANTKLIGWDRIAEQYLREVVRTPDGLESVTCILHIPQEKKKQCETLFGQKYAEHEDAYLIEIEEKSIMVYTESRRGALYAADRIASEGPDGLPMGFIYNYPEVDFRMLKLYLPSEENIPFFKHLIDICVHYGYNAVMLEVGGAMEYRSHPEINEGWREYSRETSEHINKRGSNPYFPYASEEVYFLKNSIHCENGGGTVLSQAQVKELIAYCKERFFEVIPEVPSLSHSDYLLTRHPELAERQNDLYPDAYCPSNPESYRLLFDIMEEIIEVFEPKRMNIGHDELYSIGLCERCRGKEPVALYVEDIMKIYRFLKERGVATMIWADKLINCIDKLGNPWGGARKEVKHPKTGKLMEEIAPTYTAIDRLPTDICLSHWFWSMDEKTEEDFVKRGFWTALTNMEPLRVKHLGERLKKGINGVGVSNWSKVDGLHIQRNGIYLSLALTALTVWSGYFEEDCIDTAVRIAASDLYRWRTQHAVHKAEILHAFLKDVPYEMFLDGREVDRDKNIIGSYVLEFEDGSCEKVPMEYGKTVGYVMVERKRKESDWCASYAPDNRLLEPAYSCDYEFYGDKTYYRFGLLSEKKIKNLRVELKPAYEGLLDIKEIKVEK